MDLRRPQASQDLMKAVDEEEGCGDTHAVAFVNQQLSRKEEIKANGKSIIGDEVDVVFGTPPAAIQAHTQHVLEHTIGRRQFAVRGRLTGNFF